MVELQYIKEEIEKVGAICTLFTSGTADAANKFQEFKTTINAQPNLVFVVDKVNGAKGFLFGDKDFGDRSTSKTAKGVASYLKLIKSDAKNSAEIIKKEMDGIMPKGSSFGANFVSKYTSKMDELAAKATSAAASLPNPPAPGGLQIIDLSAALKAKAKAAAKAPAKKKPAAKAPVGVTKNRAAPKKSTASKTAKKLAKKVVKKGKRLSPGMFSAVIDFPIRRCLLSRYPCLL
ncbi:hypothetical protein PM082_006677 [Marasmius tenuissimus]|nr:hypothetical protein PM082_006677 [Marasmius tenuissimus]